MSLRKATRRLRVRVRLVGEKTRTIMARWNSSTRLGSVTSSKSQAVTVEVCWRKCPASQCIAIWVRDSDSESPGELEGTSTNLSCHSSDPGPELTHQGYPEATGRAGQVRFKLQSQLAGCAFRVLFKVKFAQFPPPSRAMPVPPHRRHGHCQCRATAVAACRRLGRLSGGGVCRLMPLIGQLEIERLGWHRHGALSAKLS